MGKLWQTIKRHGHDSSGGGGGAGEGHAIPKDEELGSCPPFGTKAVWGLRYTMEDKWAAVPNMIDVPTDYTAPARRTSMGAAAVAAGALASAAASCGCIGRASRESKRLQDDLAGGGEQEALIRGGSQAGGGSGSGVSGGGGGGIDALHYFGVYDGHGGAEAAKHCAARMHHVLLECIRAALDGDEAALLQTPPAAAPPAGQGDKSHSVSGDWAGDWGACAAKRGRERCRARRCGPGGSWRRRWR
ncbi:hypothetical protein MNEG_14436 [Monoraphidium neglectum]|uniref:Uncharacterized protein n=1 Tax=Monoraphidium neglectum TaxID=145388 RepID=A0A0D2LV75_9CHLO|nr:hypothetical protein MNEG_14436 [Monoraphidium neglectum]KIY93526.1 hypothetical protein MNEG_14436 [Monoraphidium neglectum]|eukprot:XP_013892546.1 hypothetical protein MNEG_14436 [Monoraphidium neglectum]